MPIFSEEAIAAVYSIGQESLRKMNNILTKCLIKGANEGARGNRRGDRAEST